MKSPAHLAAKLDRNLVWRKRELTQIKLLADSATPQNADVLRRSGITLMYAHWEGFVKDASVLYLKFLSSRAVEVGKLKSCFVAVALRSSIYVAGQTRKKSHHSNLVELLRSIDSPPPKMQRIPVHGVITTRSNLKGPVFREIAMTLGIDYGAFELKEKPIINRLAEFRNSIAHGAGRAVSKPDYDTLHTETIILMDAYKDSIQDAADNDRHFR